MLGLPGVEWHRPGNNARRRRVWNRGDDRMKLIVLGPSLDDVRERAAERQAAADAERARCWNSAASLVLESCMHIHFSTVHLDTILVSVGDTARLKQG